jgi:integrase
MPGKSPRVPRYRRHSSGQARVTLDGKDYLLGTFGSAESHEAYRRIVAEWLETRGNPPAGPSPAPIGVSELILQYYKHAQSYYGFDRDKVRGDRYCLRDALRVVKEMYGSTLAIDFGPLALKACRSTMITKGWARSYVNSQIGRIRRMFRWGAEEEKIPGSVYQNLQSVAGLRSGKSGARETEKVRPVPAEHIDASLPLMPPPIAAMARFQLLTGCRPAEVCLVRPRDIDMTDSRCWVFRPDKHKTQHHGHERMILIGPKAQVVLRPFLETDLDSYCFSPAKAEQTRSAQRRKDRKAPMTPSQLARGKKSGRRRAPGDRYDSRSYRKSIARACEKAGVPAWGPNRLRHNRATELRVHGLDVTKTVLGHSKVETTQIYAEKDVRAAMELVAKIG